MRKYWTNRSDFWHEGFLINRSVQRQKVVTSEVLRRCVTSTYPPLSYEKITVLKLRYYQKLWHFPESLWNFVRSANLEYFFIASRSRSQQTRRRSRSLSTTPVRLSTSGCSLQFGQPTNCIPFVVDLPGNLFLKLTKFRLYSAPRSPSAIAELFVYVSGHVGWEILHLPALIIICFYHISVTVFGNIIAWHSNKQNNTGHTSIRRLAPKKQKRRSNRNSVETRIRSCWIFS